MTTEERVTRIVSYVFSCYCHKIDKKSAPPGGFVECLYCLFHRRISLSIDAAIREAEVQMKERCALAVEATQVAVYCPPDSHVAGTYDQGEQTLANAAAAVRALESIRE